MTTIAFDGRTLAADRGCWSGVVQRPVKKVYKVNLKVSETETKPALLGICGSLGFAAETIQFLQGERSEPPSLENREMSADETVGVLIVQGAGGVPVPYILFASMASFEVREQKIAMGSGSEVAYGALDAGASAEQAINIAIKRTTEAAIGVDTISFED